MRENSTSIFVANQIVQSDALEDSEHIGFHEKLENAENLERKTGITVMASRNAALVRKVCSRAIWLDGGRIRAFDDVDKVHDLMNKANKN